MKRLNSTKKRRVTRHKTARKQTGDAKSIKRGHKNSKTYSKSDYESGDGMLTSIWGPSIWHFLHTMSFNYPVHPTEDDKRNYMAFVKQLRYVLPCGHCRKNLKKNLELCPLTMECMKSREQFSRFVYRLHETVNKMLHKESGLTYEEVRERYEHFRARCTLDKTKGEGAAICKPINVNGKGKKGAKEMGCTEPLYGKKAKCVIKIVPEETKCSTFEIDQQCIKTRGL